MIVFGAIAPHGGVSLAGSEGLRDAMRELARRCEAVRPEAIVVVTPHNVHLDGSFAVVVAATLAGEVEGEALTVQTERELAEAIAAAVPATRVSYGANDPAFAEMPLDWGAHVPLWYLPKLPVVVVSPAREHSLADHVRAGEAIARATGARRVALVASADHAHTHADGGPYHVDAAAAAAYDDRVVELVRANRLDELLGLGDAAQAGLADSLWQMLMLHGALGDGFDAELLAYEAPTYFGMAVAAFAPAPEPRAAVSRPRRTLFDSYVIVDWSAESTPKTGRDSIWTAHIRRGETVSLENHSTRADAIHEVRALLRSCVAAGERVLIGFDFPYGYPHGLADAVWPGAGPAWRRTWSELNLRIEDDARNRSNRFSVAAAMNEALGPPGPFWGCPATRATALLEATKTPFPHPRSGVAEFRVTDAWLRRRGRRVLSAWQLAYAGSVGSQSLVGIPKVAALRDDPELASVSGVWPFETGFTADALPQVLHVEIWPGVVDLEVTRHAVRDAAQVLTLAYAISERDEAEVLGEWLRGPDDLTGDELAAAVAEEGWILGAR